MSHSPDDELISAYLDGELTADEEARVEKLLAASAECRQLYEELRALRASLESLPRLRAPEGLAERVLRRAERELLAAQPAAAAPAAPSPSAARPRSWRPLVYAVAAVAAAVLIVVSQGVNPLGERRLARAPAKPEPGPTGAASIGAAPQTDPAARDAGGEARYKLGKDYSGIGDETKLGGVAQGQPLPETARVVGGAAESAADMPAPSAGDAADGAEPIPGPIPPVPGPAVLPRERPAAADDVPATRSLAPVAPRAALPKAAKGLGQAAPPAAKLEARPLPAADADENGVAGVEMLPDSEALEETVEQQPGNAAAGSVRGDGAGRNADELGVRRRAGFAGGTEGEVAYLRIVPAERDAEDYSHQVDAVLAEQGIQWSSAAVERLAKLPALAPSGARGGRGPSSFAAQSAAVDVADAVFLEATSDALDDVLDSLRERGFQVQPLAPTAGAVVELHSGLVREPRAAPAPDEADVATATAAQDEDGDRRQKGQELAVDRAGSARGYAVRLSGRGAKLSELQLRDLSMDVAEEAAAKEALAEKKSADAKRKADQRGADEPQRASQSKARAGGRADAELGADKRLEQNRVGGGKPSSGPPHTVRIVLLFEAPAPIAAEAAGRPAAAKPAAEAPQRPAREK